VLCFPLFTSSSLAFQDKPKIHEKSRLADRGRQEIAGVRQLPDHPQAHCGTLERARNALLLFKVFSDAQVRYWQKTAESAWRERVLPWQNRIVVPVGLTTSGIAPSVCAGCL
jgi:hypothetical protein